jgi:type II secretory pathway pseudopilin PulG
MQVEAKRGYAIVIGSEPTRSSGRVSLRRHAGFTLIDLMVSMAVMAVLIGLMAPSIGLISEAARRVKCQKKLADIGLAMTMWVDDHRGVLPLSEIADNVFNDGAEADSDSEVIQSSALMEIAHLAGGDPNQYDGLGRLLEYDYINDASSFYCPSHDGEHPYEQYARSWIAPGDEIVINFHYRLFENSADSRLAILDPKTVLVTDGMRSIVDYNHSSGNNLLRADMSVSWYSDDQNYIVSLLPKSESEPNAGVPLASSWAALDTGNVPDGQNPNFNPNTNAVISFD